MGISLELEIGNLNNLRGSAIVYWLNKSDLKEDEIIAVNFVLSALPLENNLIATTFPLVSFKGRKEFMFYVNLSGADTIYMGESHLKKEDSYFALSSKQYKELNAIIESYLKQYRQKISVLNENATPVEIIESILSSITKLEKKKTLHKKDLMLEIEKNVKLFFLLEEVKNVLLEKELIDFLIVLKSRHKNKMEILRLTIKKYFAILDEEYEEAFILKNKVQSLKISD